jgi:hypothetical protein
VHLSTQFHAVVDGVNGNTYLQPVNARFLIPMLWREAKWQESPARKEKTLPWTSTSAMQPCKICSASQSRVHGRWLPGAFGAREAGDSAW